MQDKYSHLDSVVETRLSSGNKKEIGMENKPIVMDVNINEILDEKIPRSAISQREGGGGMMLDYLEGHYVTDRMNAVFGNLNWDKYIQVLKEKEEVLKTFDKYKNKEVENYQYTVVVKCLLQARFGTATKQAEDIGSCTGSSKKSFGEALEIAYKGAVTDAFKRCAKDLGQSMGLALYDKEQPNVIDDGLLPISLEECHKPDELMTFIRLYTQRTDQKPIELIGKLKEEFKFKELKELDFLGLKKVAAYLAVGFQLKSPILRKEVIKDV
jgi:hypothetical protein